MLKEEIVNFAFCVLQLSLSREMILNARTVCIFQWKCYGCSRDRDPPPESCDLAEIQYSDFISLKNIFIGIDLCELSRSNED